MGPRYRRIPRLVWGPGPPMHRTWTIHSRGWCHPGVHIGSVGNVTAQSWSQPHRCTVKWCRRFLENKGGNMGQGNGEGEGRREEERREVRIVTFTLKWERWEDSGKSGLPPRSPSREVHGRRALLLLYPPIITYLGQSQEVASLIKYPKWVSH